MKKQTVLQKPEDRRCRKTKTAIKNALLLLIQEKPVSEISISELAALSDINRKTFYNHYSDVEAVFDELEDECIQHLFSLLKEDTLSTYLEDPYPFFARLSHEVSCNADSYRLLLISGKHTDMEQKAKQKLKTLMQDMIPKHMISAETKFNFFLDFFASGVSSAYSNWILNGGDLEVLTRELYAMTCAIKKYMDESS